MSLSTVRDKNFTNEKKILNSQTNFFQYKDHDPNCQNKKYNEKNKNPNVQKNLKDSKDMLFKSRTIIKSESQINYVESNKRERSKIFEINPKYNIESTLEEYFHKNKDISKEKRIMHKLIEHSDFAKMKEDDLIRELSKKHKIY